MLSYHNDPKIKAKYQARFAAHRAADEVTQGLGFDEGRGCFVGCTLDAYDHLRFPVELGWPEWLAYLADAIFEGLPEADAPQFGTDLLEAVPVGVDLDPVRHMLTVARMDRLLPTVDPEYAAAIATLRAVKQCAEAELCGEPCDWPAAERSAAESARSAARAARSAARAARSAAWSAAWSAESAQSAAQSAARSAWSAAWSAESAQSAAQSAARSAAWSAESAARSAAWSAESAAGSAAWSAESAWSAAESAAGSAAWSAERDALLDALRALKQSNPKEE